MSRSALLAKANAERGDWNVRFGPIADIGGGQRYYLIFVFLVIADARLSCQLLMQIK